MNVTHERITDTHWGERGSLVLDWGGMSAYLLRIGEYVYACTFCEPRWFLWRRDPAGTWERGASGPMLRTPLLLAGPEGRIHVISAGVHWTSREPGDFRALQARELPQPCGTMIERQVGMKMERSEPDYEKACAWWPDVDLQVQTWNLAFSEQTAPAYPPLVSSTGRPSRLPASIPG
jgi:hypothetical protein